jgi:hypothetical protein
MILYQVILCRMEFASIITMTYVRLIPGSPSFASSSFSRTAQKSEPSSLLGPSDPGPIVFDLRSIVLRKYWKNHICVINEALKNVVTSTLNTQAFSNIMILL